MAGGRHITLAASAAALAATIQKFNVPSPL
jgi:hypothetical protein